MRRTTQTFVLAVLPVLGLLACTEQAGQQSASGEMEMSMAMDPMELRSAIESAAVEFEEAFNAGDPTALGAMYASDATLLPDGSDLVKGGEAVQGFWAEFLAGAPEGAAIDLETTDVRGAGDLAYEVGRFTVTADGERIDEGKYLVVWKHEADGSWKLLIDAWNRNVSPEM